MRVSNGPRGLFYSERVRRRPVDDRLDCNRQGADVVFKGRPRHKFGDVPQGTQKQPCIGTRVFSRGSPALRAFGHVQSETAGKARSICGSCGIGPRGIRKGCPRSGGSGSTPQGTQTRSRLVLGCFPKLVSRSEQSLLFVQSPQSGQPISVPTASAAGIRKGCPRPNGSGITPQGTQTRSPLRYSGVFPRQVQAFRAVVLVSKDLSARLTFDNRQAEMFDSRQPRCSSQGLS